MIKLAVFLALMVVVGCESQPGYVVSTSSNNPLEVKIVNDPILEAKVKDLEVRVDSLERWAQRQGAKQR